LKRSIGTATPAPSDSFIFITIFYAYRAQPVSQPSHPRFSTADR
jgi:hypothetical protein